MATPTLVQIGDNAGNLIPVIGKQADFSFTAANAAGTNPQAAITGLDYYHSAIFFAQLQGVTGGTLDIYLQWTPDGGGTWVDYMHFAQLAAGAATIYRAFAISRSGQQLTLTTVGINNAPALAAGTIIGGDWSNQLRVQAVTGGGTSAGSAQTMKAFFTP